MPEIKTRIGPGGRIVIPSAFRKKLGIAPGDDVVLVLETDDLRLMTPRRALQRSRALVRRYVRPSESLVDELIAERHQQADRE